MSVKMAFGLRWIYGNRKRLNKKRATADSCNMMSACIKTYAKCIRRKLVQLLQGNKGAGSLCES